MTQALVVKRIGIWSNDSFSLAAFVAFVLVGQILLAGQDVSLLFDIAFVVGCLAIKSTRHLVLLLLVTAMSWPAIPAIDRLFGVFSALECVALVLLLRNIHHFRCWRVLWTMPVTLFWSSAVLMLFFLIAVLKGQSFTDSTVLMRYLLLMHLTAFALRLALIGAPDLNENTDNLVYTALVISTLVYSIVYIAQFVDITSYDRLFIDSGGVREGSRVAYQIHFYLGILSATCLFKLIQPKAQTGHELPKSIIVMWILSLLGLFLTESRMVMLETLIVCVLLICTRPALRSWLLVLTPVFVTGLIFFGVQLSTEGRIAVLFSSDALIDNLGVRLLPGVLAFTQMSQADYFLGLGLGYKFAVPWFEGREDGILATSTFIDHLWLNVFVQAGIVGVILALLVFFCVGRWAWKQRALASNTPTLSISGLFLLFGIHGFANFIYMKEVFVLAAFLMTFLNEQLRSSYNGDNFITHHGTKVA